MAKELFEGLNVNYTAVELDANTNGRQLQDVLEQMTGGRTVSIFSYTEQVTAWAAHITGVIPQQVHSCFVAVKFGIQAPEYCRKVLSLLLEPLWLSLRVNLLPYCH